MNKSSNIDWPTVMKLFAGGALTGAGVGAGTSLAHYLQSIDEKARRQSDTSYDDDVLYVDLPPKGQPLANRRAINAPKWASANSVGTFVAGSTAGLAGTYLAYNAIRNMYNEARKKQLQKELDAAHHVYVGNLGNQSDVQKAASQFGMLTKGVGVPYLALLLGALGTGVVANKALNKFFPPLERPYGTRPRKIVIRSQNPDNDVVDEPSGGVTPDEVEHLVRTTAADPKSASVDGGIADLIAAAAAGRCDEIRDNIGIGVDFMLDTVKGARFEPVSSVNQNLAISWIAADPIVSEAIQPVLAAEFHDMSPGIFKLASHIPKIYHDDLVGIVKVAMQECRKANYAKLAAYIPALKEAGSMPAMLASDLLTTMLVSEGLKRTLNDGSERNVDVADRPSHISTPISKDSPDMAAYRRGQTQLEVQDDDAKRFADKYGPEIANSVNKV
jgi:hypothetical protein